VLNCTNSGVYGRKWNALEPDQVVEETTDLVSRYNLQLLWVVDDNFLVDRDRANCHRRGDWFAVACNSTGASRLHKSCQPFHVEELKLLRRAGLSQVAQGADSGSPKVLHLMNQGFSEARNHLHRGRQAHASGHSVLLSTSFSDFPAKAGRSAANRSI